MMATKQTSKAKSKEFCILAFMSPRLSSCKIDDHADLRPGRAIDLSIINFDPVTYCSFAEVLWLTPSRRNCGSGRILQVRAPYSIC